MKNIYSLFLFVVSATPFLSAQPVCNPNGNVVIFSNYDGGILRINVDQNIPNLQIGIVSYEDDSVIISGTYSANVTKVVYAGYINSSNVNCTTNIGVKGVYGVSPTIVTINFMPVASYSNPNGYSSIICNYSCSTTTNQGGCNTPDQIVAYFNSQFSTTNSNLLFHFTQYSCWAGTQNISTGGNCCALPLSTSILENRLLESISLFPNPTQNIIHLESALLSSGDLQIEIYNLLGEKVYSEHFITNGTLSKEINTTGLEKGIYSVRMVCGNSEAVKKLIVE